jgi:RHS repeat-associated protein
MKKLLYILLLLPVLALGQTTSQNYVKTLTYKDSTATSNAAKAQVKVTYLDGLGRPIQQTSGKASATGKDIITHIAYDDFGRQPKQYLPYAATTSTLAFDASAETNTLAFYNTAAYENTANPYSETFFEASPINRPLKQGAPGAAWQGNAADNNDHTVKFAYIVNTSNDVKKFTAVATWNNTNNMYDIAFGSTGSTNHASGTLYKNITQDENKTGNVYIGTSTSATSKQNSVHEFKNQKGQVLLKKTFNINSAGTAETLDTYYVYDQFGNLTYVLPPLAAGSTTQLADLCYQYKYDARNRLVEKKLPGKQWEYMVYDSQDRIVASGPALSPFGGLATGWLITKYDAFGRVAYTGWYAASTFTSTTRKDMQANAFAVVTKTSTSAAIDGIQVNYTNSYPTDMKLLSINYYDNYTFYGGPTPPAAGTLIEGQQALVNVKSLATGVWLRALTGSGDTYGETTYTFYDSKGRPIRTMTTNYLGGYTQTDSKLDFDGTTLYTITKHKRIPASTEIKVREDFTYTAQDRLLSQTHDINDASYTQLLSYNTYNELGQLKTKKVGSDDFSGATPLQQIDYTYNIRGWLKGINDVTNLASQGQLVVQDLFAFAINYNGTIQQTISGKVIPLYNGNIAETSWRTAADNIQRRYGNTYDKLSRLTDAWYQIPMATVPVRNSYDEHLTYDKNGNIMHLDRNGESDDATTVIAIDNLDYTYTGNQLVKVVDSTTHTAGFKDSTTNAVPDYSYDNNGNMTADNNKGITSILYNHLNQPTEIVFNSNSNTKINYIYNAAGEKLKKTVKNTGTVTTDYLTGFQYQDDVMEFFPTTEGFVKHVPPPPGGQSRYTYVFNYTDHLGNIRLSYAEDPSDGVTKILEENHYYPFGLKHNGYSATQQMVKGQPQFPPVVIVPVTNLSDVTYKYKYNGKEFQDEIVGSSALNTYDFGARNYDPAIGRWMNIDPMAEQGRRWSPYNYAYNNPVFFVDPDGMLPGPGDEFATPKDAAIDFGKEYNGMSIMFNKEIGTIYYSYLNSSGQTKYSYTVPEMGAEAGFVRGESSLASVPEGATPVKGGHTHSATNKDYIQFNSDNGTYRDWASMISGQDMYLSENEMPNAFGKPMPEVVTGPDGGTREYDPAKHDSKNSDYIVNKPIDKSVPSDPNAGKARLNYFSPEVVPKVLPSNYNPGALSIRPKYKHIEAQFIEAYNNQQK